LENKSNSHLISCSVEDPLFFSAVPLGLCVCNVRSFHCRLSDNLYDANIMCSPCVIGRWRGFLSELAAFWWSTRTSWSEVPGPTRSNLFYPALGMPLASAMFGVSLSSYIAMAVVRTRP